MTVHFERLNIKKTRKEKMKTNPCKITAICNQKGGVTKTTTTVNLGIGLAMEGRKVLLVDIDPQADLTTSLGWKDTDSLPVTLANIMEKVMNDEDVNPKSAILNHNEGVDLIPASLELSGIDVSLVNAMSREFALRSCLEPLKQDYDHIIIDCPPSLSMLTLNALVASDSVIIPVQAQYLPAKGMTQLMKTIAKVRKQVNPNLKVEGIVLTLADMRTNLARLTAETLKEQYGSMLRIFKTQIPIAVKAAETSVAGQSIYAYDNGSKVAQAYTNFTKEVLSNEERTKIRPAPGR